MTEEIRFFNLKKDYERSKKQLGSKKSLKIIEKLNRDLNLKKSEITLSENYSPTFAVILHYFKDFKNKKLLEIGFSSPYFLEFLKHKGFDVKGIDVAPFLENEKYLKMSVEKLSLKFAKEHSSYFDIITSKITLSRLYNERTELKTGKPAYKSPGKILKNISNLLKNRGILILQEDRGSIFSEKDFSLNGFRCLVKPYPIILHDQKGNYSGWNVISAYRLKK